MKNYGFLFIVFVLSISLSAQEALTAKDRKMTFEEFLAMSGEEKETVKISLENEREYKSARNKTRMGIILTTVGIPSSIIFGIYFALVKQEYDYSSPTLLCGSISYGLAGITGIPLMSVGMKEKRDKEKRDKEYF